MERTGLATGSLNPAGWVRTQLIQHKRPHSSMPLVPAMRT